MPELMDALVKREAGPGLVLTKVAKPEPGPGEVLIKIRKTAICGTDVHIYIWNDWAKEHIKPPQTAGHEYVGEVAALGAGVTGFKIGERVTGEGHIVCGHCRNCRRGMGHLCKQTRGVGVDRDGAFAEYLCIPATNVIRIDESIPDDIISFFDAFGNAAHTALTYDVVGQDVLLTGAGPIGIMAGAICRKNGARNVVITDVNEYRLALAEKMGCTPCNVKTQKLEDVMKSLKINEGFDVGYEMSGAPAALDQMIKNMYNGGQIALLGIAEPQDGINWNEVIFKALTVHGVYGRKMFETWYMMEAMVLGGLDLSPMITHRYNYRDYEKGFEAMISGKSGKVVLDWTK